MTTNILVLIWEMQGFFSFWAIFFQQKNNKLCNYFIINYIKSRNGLKKFYASVHF